MFYSMDGARGVSNHIVVFIERKRTTVVMSLFSHSFHLVLSFSLTIRKSLSFMELIISLYMTRTFPINVFWNMTIIC